MLTVKAVAQNWNMSVRNVQDLCRRGRIDGARRMGRDWMIPRDAVRPQDARRTNILNEPLIRKTPFIAMTDLYNKSGAVDTCVQAVASHYEARRLFEAEIDYYRGDIDKVYDSARFFLSSHSGFYATISGGMLLSQCAMWKGDIDMWHLAKRHICEAPCKTGVDHDIIALSLAACDSMIRRTDDYPEWFKTGCFDRLPYDAQPAARIYYVKYLITMAHELAVGKLTLDDVKGLGLMKIIPYITEPMISQAVVEGTVLVEIYLRMLCGVVHLQCGNVENARHHVDRAIALCLADGLLVPLVENRRLLGVFLDERILLASDVAAKKVKDMHKKLHAGWVKLYNAVMQSRMEITLSAREREVARLVAYGLSNQEIASRLCISTHTVRAMLNSVKNKTGALSRSEIADFI